MIREQVAEEVRAMGARRGYSQTKVAGVLGCSQAAVSRKYRGEVPFDIDELAKLAGEYDVPITTFLPVQTQGHSDSGVSKRALSPLRARGSHWWDHVPQLVAPSLA